MISTPPTNLPWHLPKADIQEILANHELHAETLAEGVTADNTYYSSKIPFGFGYGDATADFGSDNAGVAHGTHVAGIVAGNMPEEAKKTFKMDTMGLAPEAQLLVMNVSDRQGGIYFDAILAAMEDCIILGGGLRQSVPGFPLPVLLMWKA